MKRLVIAGVAVMLLLAACGGSHEGHDAGGREAASGTEGSGQDSEPGFGSAAVASEATRTVEVNALDALAFEPGSIRVEAGEVVTFVVTNPGRVPHEFVLGDEEYQEEHEEMMQGGHEMEHGDNAVELPPGETAELTWRFADAGEVLFACHVAGHYEGGMVGTITVS